MIPLLDEYLAGKPDPRTAARFDELVRREGRRAERFVFSPDASALAGQLAHGAFDLIWENRQFAIPPFDPCYLEFDATRYFDGIQTTADLYGAPRDTRLGYLLTGNRVFTLVDSRDKDGRKDPRVPPVLFSQVAFELAAPGERPTSANVDFSTLPVAGISLQGRHFAAGEVLGMWALGAQAEQRHSAELTELGQRIGVIWTLEHSHGNAGLERAMQDCAGELKHVWAFLLWLNQPAKVRFDNSPAGGRMVGNKRVAYQAHRTVHIELGRTSIRKAFNRWAEERLSPRRHKVRGHFCHSGGDVNHGHTWPQEPDVDGHWRCSGCGRLRWWKESHVRGDATRGWVTHDYQVETPGEDVRK